MNESRVCPRCGADLGPSGFYGPCATCRAELRTHGREGGAKAVSPECRCGADKPCHP